MRHGQNRSPIHLRKVTGEAARMAAWRLLKVCKYGGAWCPVHTLGVLMLMSMIYFAW